MDLRNRYAVITARSLLGIALIAFGAMGLFIAPPTEGMSAEQLASVQGLEALGIAKLISVIEVAAGLLLVTGWLPALGALLFAPIAVGILAYHVAWDLPTIVPGLVVALVDAYLGYAYWDRYAAIFRR